MLSTNTLLFVSLFLFYSSFNGQICQRDVGPIDNSARQCLGSATFDVENCCYVCPTQDASGYTETCNSLYDLGFGSCTQTGALEAMRTTCSNNGGNPDGTSFRCSCTGGTNKSQTTDYVPLSTNSPTGTPTQSSTNAASIPVALSLSSVLFIFALFIH